MPAPELVSIVSVIRTVEDVQPAKVLRCPIMDTIESAINSISPKGLTKGCPNADSQRPAVMLEVESAGKVWVQEI